MLEKLRAEWKAMNTRQKVKLCVGIVSDLGCGFIVNSLAVFAMADDDNRLKRSAVNVSSLGLGIAVGDTAKKGLNSLVDAFFDALEGKEKKDD